MAIEPSCTLVRPVPYTPAGKHAISIASAAAFHGDGAAAVISGCTHKAFATAEAHSHQLIRIAVIKWCTSAAKPRT